MDHTVLPANTPCLPFLRKCSPDGVTLLTDIQLQLIYRPQRVERLSWPTWPGWLTYSERFTHIAVTISHRSSEGQGKFAGHIPKINIIDSVTATAGCNAADCLVSHYIVIPIKIRPPLRCCLSSKLFDHFGGSPD